MGDLSGSEIPRAFAPAGSLLWQCTTPLFSRAGLGRRQQNTIVILEHHGAAVPGVGDDMSAREAQAPARLTGEQRSSPSGRSRWFT